MSDRIVVMNQGLVEQVGSPREVYEHPTSVFVAKFIGQCTLLEGRLERDQTAGGRFVTRTGIVLTLSAQSGASNAGRACSVVIRPEYVRILGAGEGAANDAANTMEATVEDAVYVGERINLNLRLPQGDFILAAGHVSPGRPLPQHGDHVRIALPPEDLSVVALGGERGQ